jgi:hypothetical protein
VLNVTTPHEPRLFVGFRLAAAALAKVDDLAEHRGTDRSEALRYLLIRGWQAHEAQPHPVPDVKQPADRVKQPPADDPDAFPDLHAKLNRYKRAR